MQTPRHAMSILVGTVLLLAASCTHPAAAQTREEAAVSGKIVALEKAWNQAYKAGDKRALGEILDENIVLINDDGASRPRSNSWTV